MHGKRRHFSLIATLVDWLCCHFSLVFLAFHPVLKLQQDVTDDRSSASPFVSNFPQVSKHSIATLNMIVRSYLTANRNRAVEVAQELDHVFLLQNLKCFGQMIVAEVRLVASHSSPDFPGLIFAAANLPPQLLLKCYRTNASDSNPLTSPELSTFRARSLSRVARFSYRFDGCFFASMPGSFVLCPQKTK